MLRSQAVRPLTRLYPFLSGRTFANRSAFQRLVGQSNEVVWTRVPGGEMLAPLDDYIGRCAYFAGDVDGKISRVFDRIVRPGDTVLDIGTNIGVTTLRLAARVGAAGQVHAFEPNPRLAELVRRSVSRSALGQVTLHEIALGAEAGSLDLFVPPGNSGRGSLCADRVPTAAETHRVPVRRLDDALPDLGALRLVKIDVEGFEAPVIEGGEGTFARLRPDAILFETNAERPEGSARIGAMLGRLRYGLFALPKTLLRLRLDRIDPGALRGAEAHDVLALPEERADALLARLAQ